MAKIELDGQQITDTFTAGAAISDQEVVAITGDDQVSPASDTEIQETIGVANENADAGAEVEVVILGRKTVTADGAVSPGEPVVPAATTGRAVPEAAQDGSHVHAMGSHGHTALETDGTDAAPAAHQGVLAGDGGTDTTLVAGVDTSAQAAETVATSTDDIGDTNSTDTSPQNARSFGMAVTTAASAGDSFDVLVAYKSG